MPTVLITGASRGLGLEFTRQYAADGWKVFASCRHPESALDLKKLAGDIHIRAMDITNLEQIATLSAEIKGAGIDVLLNNVGIEGPGNSSASFGGLDLKAWHNVMHINAMAPFKVTEVFPLQERTQN